jgi:hypothetical protein
MEIIVRLQSIGLGGFDQAIAGRTGPGPSGVSLNNQLRLLWKAFHNRRNWLFCWSELGARQVGIIQSLLVTCKLQGINPYTYLVDVLQRISQHPASKAIDLTPRVWKKQFADNVLKSDLDRVGQ